MTHRQPIQHPTLLGINGERDAVSDAGAPPLPSYERLDATDLALAIRRGELSATDVLDAAISRLEARQGLNAITARHFDVAREAARGLDAMGRQERMRLAETRPLLGVPFLIKDLGLSMKGTVTTSGCAFFRDAVADHDSTLVQRHRAAGLNIFGKTSSPEFGQTATTESRLFGATRNPWNTDLSCGGSSGGAAVAVAAGIVPVAHATDGGGSIRIPASACGLFGLKPSRGRVPAGPAVLEASLGLSVHHVISRSVRDSALFLQLTQGPEPGSRVRFAADAGSASAMGRPHRLRVGLVTDNLFGVPIHAECLAALHAAARLCESLGHRVEPAPSPLLAQAQVAEMYAGMAVANATGMLMAVRAREKALGRSPREDEFEPLNWRALGLARGYSAEQALAARAAFDQAGRALDLHFESFDVLLSPTMAAPPPRLGAMALDQAYEDYVKHAVMASAYTSMFNISGHPAMSVPLHWSASGLPIGVQFAAAFGADELLLSLAAELEQAQPWGDRRPPL